MPRASTGEVAEDRRYPVHVRPSSCAPHPRTPYSALPKGGLSIVPHVTRCSSAHLHNPFLFLLLVNSLPLHVQALAFPFPCFPDASHGFLTFHAYPQHPAPPYLGSARLHTAATSCTPPRSTNSQPAAQPAATASATASQAVRVSHTPRAKPAWEATGGLGVYMHVVRLFHCCTAGFLGIWYWALGVGFVSVLLRRQVTSYEVKPVRTRPELVVGP